MTSESVEFQVTKTEILNDVWQVKPFIRWAGGKQNLVKELYKNLPEKITGQYFEPFLGAGSLYFFNGFPKSTLSDINPLLISTYKCIKDFPEEISERLEVHRSKISKEYYYKIRDQFNRDIKKENFDQAANFIFLNHSSYNGIFRVNLKGEYNVPFGKLKAAIPTRDHLLKINKKLQTSEILCCSFETISDKAVS